MTTDTVTVECGTCPGRERHCGDCMVTALLQPVRLSLQESERAAVRRLVAVGLLSAEQAATLHARPEPWSGARAVG